MGGFLRNRTPEFDEIGDVERGFSEHLTPARQVDREAHQSVLQRAMEEGTIEDS